MLFSWAEIDYEINTLRVAQGDQGDQHRYLQAFQLLAGPLKFKKVNVVIKEECQRTPVCCESDTRLSLVFLLDVYERETLTGILLIKNLKFLQRFG